MRHRRFLGRAERTEGEVVELVPRSHRVRSSSSSSSGLSRSRTVVTQTPVVRFTPRLGDELRVEVAGGSARLGERVEVAYDPADPDQVVIASTPWGGYAVRIAFGLFFFVFALGFFGFTQLLTQPFEDLSSAPR